MKSSAVTSAKLVEREGAFSKSSPASVSLVGSFSAARGAPTTTAQRRAACVALQGRKNKEEENDGEDVAMPSLDAQQATRTHELFERVTGDAASRDELLTARRIVETERREQRERDKAERERESLRGNSLRAMLERERHDRVLRAASLSLSHTPSLSLSTAGLVAGTRVAGTADLVQTRDGALFSPGDLSLAASRAARAAHAAQSLSSSSTIARERENTRELAENRLAAAQHAQRLVVVKDTHTLDMAALQRNTQRIAAQSSRLSLSTPAEATLARERERQRERQREAVDAKRRAADTLLEADALLRRKSSHAADAQNEWFSSFETRMDKLAKRETQQAQAAGVLSLPVNAFFCGVCRVFSETYPDLCRHQAHAVSQCKAIKRFFACAHCGKRESTLSSAAQDARVAGAVLRRVPAAGCLCGKAAWTACGLVLDSTAATAADRHASLSGDKLIAAAAEWTSQQDKLAMAARVSRLD